MTVTNQDLIQKGIITADALAAAGKLGPKQAEQFIDFVVDQTSLKGRVRGPVHERVAGDRQDRRGRRVPCPRPRPWPEVRRGIQTSKVTLAPKEIVVPFEIGDNFLELNLEGKSVEERIIRMMATQFANDIAELYLRGAVLGEAALEGDLIEGGSGTQYIKDNYLALFDGWLRLADRGHRVDLEGGQVGSGVFSKLLNAMPNKFKRDRANLRFLTSPELEQDFRQHVATRQTAAGDAALSARGQHHALRRGARSVAVPHRPVIVEHLALAGTTPMGLRYRPASEVVVSRSDLARPRRRPSARQPTTRWTRPRHGGQEGHGDDRGRGHREGDLPGPAAGGPHRAQQPDRGHRPGTSASSGTGTFSRAPTSSPSRPRCPPKVEEIDAPVKGVNIASAA